MPTTEFTLADLKRILLESAGSDEETDLDGDILDRPFEQLGYESLALLETVGRIEREYGVGLDDTALADGATPRELIDAVNGQLTAAA
ncbi:acyl carrier protein [Streptomyces sp. TRM49041]|uniref:acyl carrier protein n=1 Tax=Streptomyces sp. TRM49041 TaxID=2603216 RepID=UPI0011EC2DCF|nr:acyl carrier protein [Streptomyces sp. TRM49041]